MRGLSISAAWEETRKILAHDGRLLATVALALIALPTTVNTLINPGGMNAATTPVWMGCVAFVAYLIALAGQLSLIRLALGPSVTVGGAIGHGIRRLPIYLAAVLMIVIFLLIVLVIISLALAALGVRVEPQMRVQLNSPALVAVLIFFAIFAFLFVRFVLSAVVASAEPIGPIGILKRSWRLTDGHWWPLFGFLLIFFVGSGILVFAIGSAAGAATTLFIGKIQPMSASALVLALIDAVLSATITTLFAVMLARIYLQLSRGTGAQVSVPISGT